MQEKLNIAFFGSSLVSAYWNGAATYYRGVIKALHERGHSVTFYEPDAFDRQKHRDIEAPDYARSVVYPATQEGLDGALDQAIGADIIIKASGVGVFDEELEARVIEFKQEGSAVIFWDVDAPATLDRVNNNPNDPFRPLISQYSMVLTYGGGPPVVQAYRALGAKECHPIYNAFDPDTHHPVEPDPRFEGCLGFVGNRLPDREARVIEFFFNAAEELPAKRFLLAGNGWDFNAPSTPNVHKIGHLYTRDHNAFNCTPLAVLNIARESMARYGFSPATRVFEAAGAGACMITDAWEGIELFLQPGEECLVARSGKEVAQLLSNLTEAKARLIGEAARKRVLAEHTYAHRAEQLEDLLYSAAAKRPAVA